MRVLNSFPPTHLTTLHRSHNADRCNGLQNENSFLTRVITPPHVGHFFVSNSGISSSSSIGVFFLPRHEGFSILILTPMHNPTGFLALWTRPFTVMDELADDEHLFTNRAFHCDVVAHPIIGQLFGVYISFHGG